MLASYCIYEQCNGIRCINPWDSFWNTYCDISLLHEIYIFYELKYLLFQVSQNLRELNT